MHHVQRREELRAGDHAHRAREERRQKPPCADGAARSAGHRPGRGRLPAAGWGIVARFLAPLKALLVCLSVLSSLVACSAASADRASGDESATSSSPTAAAKRWTPRAGASWQWQLTTPVDTSVPADVYDIDANENSAQVVATLHAAARHVVCYINAGAWEPYRADAGQYPRDLLGKALDGWPDERWLDIRQLDRLAPLLSHRLDACRAKGFDGVEPDNLDGFAADSGFPLTAGDQLAFNRLVARLAHERGLAVGLKNDVGQAAALQPDFDFSVDEQCAEFHECPELSSFVKAGKPVFEAEYNLPTSAFCAESGRLGFSAMLKHLGLDAWRDPC